MINYLEKYNKLPKEIRDKVSSKQVMDAIHALEASYQVSLASLVMRVIVGDLKIDDLHTYFTYKYSFNEAKAKEIVMELDAKIFSRISNYLSYINTGKREVENQSDETSTMPPVGADFYFSIEDEEEVREKAKDLHGLDNREQIAKQVELKIDDVLSKINVIFSSESMVNRLRQILKTHLRGVRGFVDTKLVLERDIQNGGLGLDPEIADDILKVVNIIKKEEAKHPERLFRPRKFILPEDKHNKEQGNKNSGLGSDAVYDFSKLKNKQAKESETTKPELSKESEEVEQKSEEIIAPEKEQESDTDTNKTSNQASTTGESKENEINTEKKIDTGDIEKSKQDSGPSEKPEKPDKETKDLILDLKQSAPLNASTNLDQKTTTQSPEKNEETEVNTARSQKPEALRFKKPIVNPLPNRDSGKVRMDDIKRVNRQGGPIGEIANMRLADFRRLDEAPHVAAEKVMEIFSLLEEESFAKKMEGIMAWRKSPLNKLYISIGQESLISGKNIKDLIKDKKEKDPDSIREDEFNAVMSLNKKLRY